MSTDRKYFESKGPSAFIRETRLELEQKNIEKNYWTIGGKDSLTVKYIPMTDATKAIFGNGLVFQIWMERPQKNRINCKFEIANCIKGKSIEDSKTLREDIAKCLRRLIRLKGLPDWIEFRDGSTIIGIKIDLTRTLPTEDEIIADLDRKEIGKVVAFYQFLDERLNEIDINDCINIPAHQDMQKLAIANASEYSR